MAFDQHIEADQVGDDDIGLFSSIIARPILWLLGGDQDKAAEEKRKEERQQLEREILDTSDLTDNDSDEDGEGVGGEQDGIASSYAHPAYRGGVIGHHTIDDGKAGGGIDDKIGDTSGNPNQISPLRSGGRHSGSTPPTDASTAIISPPRRGDKHSHIVDDLVVAMKRNGIDQKSNAPATNAMAFHGELSASHSASEFPTQDMSPTHKMHKAHSSNSIKSKKTSWSDEHGNRPLVEYSDDHLETIESRHWTQLRRKKRRSSFDSGGEKNSSTRRSQVRVIKSALRAGSYSPPVTKMYARGVDTSPSRSVSSWSSSNQAATGGHLKSFHSLSMIGSSSGSSSPDSAYSSDSLVGATSEKSSMKDNVQCVPSTLQQGGRANGGLIIPRGGPSYHLTMGTRASGEGQQQVTKRSDAEVASNEPVNNGNLVNGRMQAKAPSPHHHVFLPHPPNGHASPQYGFYVSLTPPTTLHTKSAKRGSPLRPFEESSPQQQSFKGFSPFLPSPIPEVELAKEMGTAPTLAPLSEKSEASDVKSKLKPTFPKNRVGMGMVLAGQHHHAWPSIPMG